MSEPVEQQIEDAFRRLGIETFGTDLAVAKLEGLAAALGAEPAPPTALKSEREILEGHIADSLAGLVVPRLAGAGSILDIGSGAGFPGLALAAALRGASFDLVEATAKKAEVIARLAAASGLSNARAVAERIETWSGADGRDSYDAATVRAVAPLAVLVEYAAPGLRGGGVLVAWKGARDEVEENAGNLAAELVGLAPADVIKVVPYEGAHSRHLHVYEKSSPTPDRFPRRPGVAARRPLA
jgi:16S rRNA (guanine527-N7)-methyltransferase